MKTKTFIGMIVMLVASVFTGCGNEDNTSIVDTGGNTGIDFSVVELQAKEDLPEWLSSYIDQYENENSQNTEIKDESIYQFSWNGSLFYFHKRSEGIVIIDYIFNPEGIRIDLTEEEREDIENNSKDWKMIYRFAGETSSEDMVFSQEMAWEIVKIGVLNNELNDIDVYVSKNTIQPNTTIETYSTPELSPDYISWLFFIDDVPFGNWGHPCRYVYVNVADGKYEIHEHSEPPIMYSVSNDYIPLVQKPIEPWDESK